MADHALLSASGCKKWRNCPPSARLEAQLPDEQSEFASEGGTAHGFMEIAARYEFFGEPIPESLNTVEKRRAAGFDDDMVEAVRVFIDECKKIVDPLKASGRAHTVLIEQKLDYSPWVREGFGTGDFVVVSQNCLWVRDFKYGKGIVVESENNEQMMLYALGAYNELSFAYDGINEVDVGIVQPRAGGCSSWRVSLANLLAWGDLIRPIAELAWEGKGEFKAGTHCREGFCRARFTCRARAEQNLAVATEEFGELPDGAFLMVEEIDALLPKLAAVKGWASDLLEYAQSQAIDKGVRFPNHKLVEGRSTRYISDKKMAAVRLVANGIPQEKIHSEPELLGITALQKVCGSAKKFDELLGDLLVKPAGKPTLVAIDDPRPEWRPTATADEDFGA